MLLSSFVDEYLIPGLRKELAGEDEGRSRRIAYLAQHQLFEQLPGLLGDFDPPPVCDVAGGVQRVNAWIGTAGTVTPCHFDSYDNLLGQVAGYKFVRLYSEDDSPFLYRHQGAWAENRSWPARRTARTAAAAAAAAAVRVRGTGLPWVNRDATLREHIARGRGAPTSSGPTIFSDAHMVLIPGSSYTSQVLALRQALTTSVCSTSCSS